MLSVAALAIALAMAMLGAWRWGNFERGPTVDHPMDRASRAIAGLSLVEEQPILIVGDFANRQVRRSVRRLTLAVYPRRLVPWDIRHLPEPDAILAFMDLQPDRHQIVLIKLGESEANFAARLPEFDAVMRAPRWSLWRGRGR